MPLLTVTALAETGVTASFDVAAIMQSAVTSVHLRLITTDQFFQLAYFSTFTFLVLQKRSSGKILQKNCPTAPSDPGIEFYIYKVCPTNLRRSPASCRNFVRQHQKRAGSFSSSPFPVDHYSVLSFTQRLQPFQAESDTYNCAIDHCSCSYCDRQNFEQITLHAGHSIGHDFGNVKRTCCSIRSSYYKRNINHRIS